MSIGIVIQGPFHENCLNVIDEYKKYGPVVISCYSTDNTDRVPNSVNLIKSVLPKVNWYNNLNIYYQAFSTLRGLHYLDTDFIIKIRANEQYSDISKFVKKVIENPHKIITNNVAFPRNSVQALHPSDHMMGSSRHNLIETFERVDRTCRNLPFMDKEMIFGSELNVEWMGHLLPEQIIALNWLEIKGITATYLAQNHSLENLKKIMLDNYDMVPVEDLGDVVHSIWVGYERRFRRGGEGLYGYPHESIKNISEV